VSTAGLSKFFYAPFKTRAKARAIVRAGRINSSKQIDVDLSKQLSKRAVPFVFQGSAEKAAENDIREPF
jgi:hypothetical protein